MRAAPYRNDELIGQLTKWWLDRDMRVLVSHVRGGSERAHCRWLLDRLAPPKDARVLDIGSGVGAVADQMTELRPDLRFTLLNISPWQLAHSSPVHARACADMEALPFGPRAFDCALICFAIGYGSARQVLAEACRVARAVLVYDVMARDAETWAQHLHYRVPSRAELERFGHVELIPTADGGRFEALLPGFWQATGAELFTLRI